MRHIFTSHFLKTMIIESAVILVELIGTVDAIVKKKEWFPESLEEKGELIVKILALAVLVILIINCLIPKYKDLPYFNNNEFCYMEGVAQNYSDRAAKNAHHVRIKDEESGEEIRVHFGYKSTIKQGDQLKVKYLPNSKEALLLELNGKEVDAVIF